MRLTSQDDIKHTLGTETIFNLFSFDMVDKNLKRLNRIESSKLFSDRVTAVLYDLYEYGKLHLERRYPISHCINLTPLYNNASVSRIVVRRNHLDLLIAPRGLNELTRVC